MATTCPISRLLLQVYILPLSGVTDNSVREILRLAVSSEMGTVASRASCELQVSNYDSCGLVLHYVYQNTSRAFMAVFMRLLQPL